jgi:hypothetical protein
MRPGDGVEIVDEGGDPARIGLVHDRPRAAGGGDHVEGADALLMRGMLRWAIDSERSQKSVGRSASNRCRWRSGWPRRDVGRPAVSPEIVDGRDEGNCRAAMTAKKRNARRCSALHLLAQIRRSG